MELEEGRQNRCRRWSKLQFLVRKFNEVIGWPWDGSRGVTRAMSIVKVLQKFLVLCEIAVCGGV
jgi:hypothetical protein